jgi:molybdopterin-binding protein
VSRSSRETGDVTVVLGLGEDGSGARILARVTYRSWSTLGLREGMEVYAQIKGVSLEAASGQSDHPLSASVLPFDADGVPTSSAQARRAICP